MPALTPSAPDGVDMCADHERAIPIVSIVRLRSAMSATLGGEMEHQSFDEPGYVSQIVTSRASSPNGSGRRRTPFTTLKIAVVTPMPSASVRMTAALKPGRARTVRSAWRTLRAQPSGWVRIGMCREWLAGTTMSPRTTLRQSANPRGLVAVSPRTLR